MQHRLAHPQLIHVAASGEGRGRVLLAARTGMPHPAAIDAAMVIARGFDAALEALLIECADVRALTDHGFARAVSHGGRIAPLSLAEISGGQSSETQAAQTILEAAARRAGATITVTPTRDQYERALADACTAEGPWNIVCLAEPVGPRDGAWLAEVLESTSGATGLCVVGANGTAASEGDVVVVVETIDRFSQMLRAAERLAGACVASPRTIRLLLAGATPAETEEMDGFIRLALPQGDDAGRARVVLSDARVAHGTHAELAEALRRLEPRFVIARMRGLAAPAEGSMGDLLGVLRAPLLLVR